MWMEQTQDHVHWRDLVFAVLNLRVLLPDIRSPLDNSWKIGNRSDGTHSRNTVGLRAQEIIQMDVFTFFWFRLDVLYCIWKWELTTLCEGDQPRSIGHRCEVFLGLCLISFTVLSAWLMQWALLLLLQLEFCVHILQCCDPLFFLSLFVFFLFICFYFLFSFHFFVHSFLSFLRFFHFLYIIAFFLRLAFPFRFCSFVHFFISCFSFLLLSFSLFLYLFVLSFLIFYVLFFISYLLIFVFLSSL